MVANRSAGSLPPVTVGPGGWVLVDGVAVVLDAPGVGSSLLQAATVRGAARRPKSIERRGRED
jgi:hypothetical protein